MAYCTLVRQGCPQGDVRLNRVLKAADCRPFRPLARLRPGPGRLAQGGGASPRALRVGASFSARSGRCATAALAGSFDRALARRRPPARVELCDNRSPGFRSRTPGRSPHIGVLGCLPGDGPDATGLADAATGRLRKDSTRHRTRSSSELSIDPFSVTTCVTSPRSTTTVAVTGGTPDNDEAFLYAILVAHQSIGEHASTAASRRRRLRGERGVVARRKT